MGLTMRIKDFKAGDKVIVTPRGTFRNIPHPRYRGMVGVVMGRRGDAYEVRITLSKSTSRLLVVPQMHLEKAK